MTSVHTTALRRLRRATNGRPAPITALVVAIILILVATPEAQQMPAPGFTAAPASTPMAASMVAVDAPTSVDLLVGRSTVLNVGSAIARVSLTVPDIADAMVTAPSQLLIHGKQPGTISLFVWDRAGAIKTFEVNVRRDLTPLVAHLKQLFPSESITVIGSGKDVVISGTVSSKYVMEKAADVAGGYVEKKENVVNLLQQQEGVASNQVMLRVRFAEVSRSAMTELGAALFTGPGGFHDYVARSTTQQFAAPNYKVLGRDSIQGPPDRWGGGRDTVSSTGGEMQFSDFLNLFIFNNKYNVGTVVKALQERGLFQSLAEPNLIATNGKEASFLAGGEFPIPVVQGGAQGPSVTIMFKEFGVRLNFTPTVLGGDLINLKVRPEVSALDFNNAIVIEGFRVPALTSRRTETEVELRDGQTFAIAGLMNNSLQDAMRKIPGIGDIPILGWLFKSKAMQKSQTELVVLITPHIVKQGQMGVSEGLPSLVEPYLGSPDRTHPNPDPYVGSPRYPANQPAPRSDNVPVQPASPVAEVTPELPVVPVGAALPLPTAPDTRPLPAAPATSADDAFGQPSARMQPADPLPQAVPYEPLTRDEVRALDRARAEERQAAAQAGADDARAAAAARKAQAAAEKAQREQDKRDAERRRAEARAAEKRGAEEARRQAELAKKQEEQQRTAARLEEERQKREAEVARKNAADAQRQDAADQRRQKALEDAASRLKAAQEAYQAELARGGGQ